jgi:hypothetical protein
VRREYRLERTQAAAAEAGYWKPLSWLRRFMRYSSRRLLVISLVEDRALAGGKRWVVVAPASQGASLLLAKAATPEQVAHVGNQTGGRVSF